MSAGDSAARIGIAGFGLAGAVFHAPLVAATPGLALTHVVTTDATRAQAARDRYPGVRVAPDVASILGEVDALVVATPNRAHVALALQALERGVAVVVDKPLAATAADARTLVDAGGDRLTVFQNRRWDGDFLTAQDLVASGTLGAVTRWESRFERFRPTVAAAAWRERADPAEGGGVLLDLGAHLVDQAIRLLGPVAAVHAELDRRRPGAAVADDVFVSLHHDSGARSHLLMSAVAPLAGPRLRLSGLAGGFAVDGLDPQEAQLRSGMAPTAAGFGVAPPGRLVTARETTWIPLRAGRYLAFYEQVAAWLGGAAPPPVDPRDAVEVLEILEAAGRSAG